MRPTIPFMYWSEKNVVAYHSTCVLVVKRSMIRDRHFKSDNTVVEWTVLELSTVFGYFVCRGCDVV